MLKSLADFSGANIVIGPQVKGTITIKLSDVTVEEALDIITKQTGLAYGLANGTYVVNDKLTIEKMFPTAQTYEIVSLKWVPATDAMAALNITFKDLETKELPDHRLVVTGAAKRLQAAKDFLQEIDIEQQKSAGPATSQHEMKEVVYTVNSVIPWQAKQYLENLYGTQGLTVVYAPNGQWRPNSSLEESSTKQSAPALPTTPAPAVTPTTPASPGTPAIPALAPPTPASKESQAGTGASSARAQNSWESETYPARAGKVLWIRRSGV